MYALVFKALDVWSTMFLLREHGFYNFRGYIVIVLFFRFVD